MKLVLAGGMFTCGAMFLSEKIDTQPEVGLPVTGVFVIGYLLILVQEMWTSRK